MIAALPPDDPSQLGQQVEILFDRAIATNEGVALHVNIAGEASAAVITPPEQKAKQPERGRRHVFRKDGIRQTGPTLIGFHRGVSKNSADAWAGAVAAARVVTKEAEVPRLEAPLRHGIETPETCL
jgi:hypothetical protein